MEACFDTVGPRLLRIRVLPPAPFGSPEVGCERPAAAKALYVQRPQAENRLSRSQWRMVASRDFNDIEGQLMGFR